MYFRWIDFIKKYNFGIKLQMKFQSSYVLATARKASSFREDSDTGNRRPVCLHMAIQLLVHTKSVLKHLLLVSPVFLWMLESRKVGVS